MRSNFNPKFQQDKRQRSQTMSESLRNGANTGSAPLSLTQSPYGMIRRILLAQLQIDYPSLEFCLPRDLSFRPTLDNLNSELIVVSL